MKIDGVIGSTKLKPIFINVTSWQEWLNLIKEGKYRTDVITGNFFAGAEDLPSFKKFPDRIGGYFDASWNKLNNFEGAPSKIGFQLQGNSISSFVDLKHNAFKSLKDIHKHIKSVYGMMYFNNNPIKSNILGLLLIDGLGSVGGDGPAFDYIQKHLERDRDVLECQEEMISAGYKEFAKL